MTGKEVTLRNVTLWDINLHINLQSQEKVATAIKSHNYKKNCNYKTYSKFNDKKIKKKLQLWDLTWQWQEMKRTTVSVMIYEVATIRNKVAIDLKKNKK